MALDSAVGHFDITTGSSDVVVSGLGFQPKVVIFFWSGRTGTTDGITDEDVHRGFGFATGVSNNRVVCSADDDGNANAQGTAACRDDACIANVSTPGSPAVDGRASLKSFDSGGFTLQIDDAFPVNFRVGYMALGGSSLTDARVGSFNEPAATGNQSQSGFGFQPDLVFFIHAGEVLTSTGVSGFNSPNATAGGGIGIGVAKSSTNRWSYSGYCEGGNPGATAQDAQSNTQVVEVIVLHSTSAGNTISGRAEFVSMDSGGFTINWLERVSTRQCFYLAIRAPSCSFVGDFATSTTLDADITQSGFGFTPNAVLCVSDGKVTQAANASTSDDAFSVGAFSSPSNRLAMATIDDDGAANVACGTASEFDAVYIALNVGSPPTLRALVDVQTIDSDGFTLNQDDADTVTARVGYVAFGNAPAAQAWGPEHGHTMISLTGVGH